MFNFLSGHRKNSYTIFYNYYIKGGGEGSGFLQNVEVTRNKGTRLDLVPLHKLVKEWCEKSLIEEEIRGFQETKRGKKKWPKLKDVIITNIIDEYKI